MKIAVLSGKGGTGKTLVAVNLAATASQAVYIDCDVEEPNGHLFFKPQDVAVKEISVKIPVVDESKCNGCRVCIDFCKFNALAYIGGHLKVFETVCHSCGGCVLFCPEKALAENDKVIGEIQSGVSENVSVLTGVLKPGEASGIPIIRQLLDASAGEAEITLVDCPPGSACIVMESIKDADYCILVAEPTLFGVHNFSMVHELVKLFDKQFGAVLNKCLPGDNPAEKFCRENDVRILGSIPFAAEIGAINSNARILVREQPKYRDLFAGLLLRVMEEVRRETTAHS